MLRSRMADTSVPPRNPYTFTRDEYNELVRNMAHRHQSQRSDYDEVELIEDCTLYDIYRQPRAPVTDPKVTRTLPVRVLNADLTCPICLGIIRNTEVVMECLHRFCSECIQRSLRVGKNECPSCRIHIPSKRSLRRDTNFDNLVAKIYPNLDEFQEQEEKLIEAINRSRHCNNALTESTKRGVQSQQSARRSQANGKKRAASQASPSSSDSSSPRTPGDDNQGPSWASAAASVNGSAASDESERKKARTGSTSNGTLAAPSPSTIATPPGSSSTAPPTATSEDDEKVNLRVLVHPDEDASAPRLAKTLFRTSYKLKVRHLKKHLASLLKLETFDNMRIVLSATNCTTSGLSTTGTTPTSATTGGVSIRKDLLFDQELDDHVTLYDIYQQYAKGTKWELQLYYHFSDTIVNGVAQFIASGV